MFVVNLAIYFVCRRYVVGLFVVFCAQKKTNYLVVSCVYHFLACSGPQRNTNISILLFDGPCTLLILRRLASVCVYVIFVSCSCYPVAGCRCSRHQHPLTAQFETAKAELRRTHIRPAAAAAMVEAHVSERERTAKRVRAAFRHRIVPRWPKQEKKNIAIAIA